MARSAAGSTKSGSTHVRSLVNSPNGGGGSGTLTSAAGIRNEVCKFLRAEFQGRRSRGCNHRLATSHCFHEGHYESLSATGKHENVAPAIEGGQRGVIHFIF